jgi:hypothetical protein
LLTSNRSGALHVSTILLRLKGLGIAIVALAVSASLAFGAQPPEAASFGLENAASHAGKTVPVAGGQPETTGEDDEEGEEAVEDEESEEAGDNCLTDPTALTDEELAEMRHGSIVCWAAHQEAPEGYRNHGEWVSEWAHAGKGGEAAAEARANGQGKGKGQGKGRPE